MLHCEMGFDLVAMILISVLYVLVRWAYASYRRLTRSRNGNSSGFNLFRFGLTSESVEWGWREPVEVGETMNFVIKFYGLARTPRDIKGLKNFKVEISRNSLSIAHIEEVIRPDSADGDRNSSAISNEIKVSFTVRASGVYTISIFEDGCHIANSPYEKPFIPGPPVASRTTLVKTLNSMSLMAITQNRPHVITVEPRDEYGNQCANRMHQMDVRDKFSLMVTEIGDDEGVPVPVSTDLRLTHESLIVDLYVPLSGCFHAAASYQGELISNGEFDLVVLSEQEAEEVKENVDKRNLNVWYEAKLLNVSQDQYFSDGDGKPSLEKTLSLGDIPIDPGKHASTSFRSRIKSSISSHSKPKSVYCYITPKQIVIKEFYFKIFPKRLQSFRLCQATKVSILCPETKNQPPIIMISDNCQPAYTLSCPKSYLLLASFVGILNKNIGGSDSFEEKVKHFRQELLSYHKIQRYSRGQAHLNIKRSLILSDSYRATKQFGVKDWSKLFQINFDGEVGVDWGGLSREWVTELCKQMFHPILADGENTESRKETPQLFRRLKDDNQALILPNPCSTSGSKMKYFEFAGKLVGKCLLDSCFERDQVKYITARFGRSFLAQIIGLAVTFKHFENDDPELYKTKIRYIIENDVSDFDLYFSEEEYSASGKLTQVVPLKQNGAKISVTNENKLEYLNRLAQYKLSTSVKEEIDTFNKGLNLLVPEHLLSIFDENELELLICGSSEIDVDDMRRHCQIDDRSPQFVRTLQWFWVVISSFTQEELGMLLQFITGCSQLPPGGFADLSPKLKISFLFYQNNVLPTAHTCFNELCLPSYESYEKLHKMLKIAIKEGSVGFGMI